MRLRLLRNIRMAGLPSVELMAGSVVDVPAPLAEKWLKQGVAMEDNSLDGPQERKAEVALPVKRKVKRHRKKGVK